MQSAGSIPFPLFVIDFEATALSLDSFPIEVGIATSSAPDAPIEAWSMLIRPDASWNIAAQWDPDAERVHKISRRDLRHGQPAHSVMAEMNARIGSGARVWCDGGHYDVHWLDTLAIAAGIKPEFEICDLSSVLRVNLAVRDRYFEILRSTQAPHRAGPDAERIAAALAAAVTHSPSAPTMEG